MCATDGVVGVVLGRECFSGWDDDVSDGSNGLLVRWIHGRGGLAVLGGTPVMPGMVGGHPTGGGICTISPSVTFGEALRHSVPLSDERHRAELRPRIRQDGGRPYGKMTE